jgi:DNA-binding beta-propeller fold protein YncE
MRVAGQEMCGGSAGTWAAAVAVAALATLGSLAVAGEARATEFVLDPALSLRGDCTTVAEDLLPDPGPCPGIPGIDHPPEPFKKPCGAATDRHGYVYVATSDIEGANRGRIDVFDPRGGFVLEIANENQPCALAVDSEGNLYVREYLGTKVEGLNSKRVALYEPDLYPPQATSDYGEPTYFTPAGKEAQGVAVDPADDHVYVTYWDRIVEHESAADGLGPIREIGLGEGRNFNGVDVWGANHDVYASGVEAGQNPIKPQNNRAFVFDGETGGLKLEIGGFGFVFGNANLAVDQSSGDAYVLDTEGADHLVKQFDAAGALIGRLPHDPPSLKVPSPFGDIAVDAPLAPGEEGYESPNEGYVFVAAGNNSTTSHLWAYRPCAEVGPPGVSGESFSGVTTAEATLMATVDPRCRRSTYRFQYTTQARFEAEGWEGAAEAPLPEGEIEPSAPPSQISVAIAGLQPGTAYRFRLLAANEGGTSEGEGVAFATYPLDEGLPEGRAYELVTPPETNGRIPTAAEFGFLHRGGFATNLVTADGESVLFGVEGGSLPGFEGGGYHDTYRALRDPIAGWQTSFAGLTGAEAREPFRGGVSADHDFSFWELGGKEGDLVPCAGADPNGVEYVRRPSGTDLPACACDPEARGRLEPIGCGSLGSDPSATGRWISAGGGHVIFTSVKRLEPEAPAAPNLGRDKSIGAVYDRAPDGTTRVLSLLPGDLTPPDGSLDFYRGVSADGRAVAFDLDGTLYVRVGGAKTLEVAEGARFGGLSEDGSRLFYLIPNAAEPLLEGSKVPQGEVFALDTATGASTPLGSGTEAVLVNVSADGSHAYFTSPEQLDGGKGKAGEDNLYAWDGTVVSFVATVDRIDVTGREGTAGGSRVGGLGLWVTHVLGTPPGSFVGPGSDPSRTTPDGRILVFESHADLTTSESEGHSQVYRYDAESENLVCLSCDPTGAAPASDSQLQSDPGRTYVDPLPPVNAMTRVANLSADGERVFFQSAERLAAGDTDGLLDVYGWRARGTGGCGRQGGCLALISSGQSSREDYLYAVSADGRDVFFSSFDLLVAQDTDSTPSIYDARVGGGFELQAVAEACVGDACQGPQIAPPPLLGGPTSASLQGSGNPGPRRCPRGKRRVRRKGKTRCVSRRALRRRARRACRKKRRGAAHRRCMRRHLRGGRRSR